MRSVGSILLLSLILPTSCARPVSSDALGPLMVDPGWHRSWDEYRNYVSYGFTDQSHTAFVGACDKEPVFGLKNGDYSSQAKSFLLTVDDRTWRLDAFQGMHGRSLPVEGSEIVEALRAAKRLIRFTVDDGWTREFKPAPDLSQMIEQCRSLRRVDPDAMGRLAHLGDRASSATRSELLDRHAAFTIPL